MWSFLFDKSVIKVHTGGVDALQGRSVLVSRNSSDLFYPSGSPRVIYAQFGLLKASNSCSVLDHFKSSSNVELANI